MGNMKEEEAQVTVQHGVSTQQLRLVVVTGRGQSLLGRDWLQKLRLDWHSIFTMNSGHLPGLEVLLKKHEASKMNWVWYLLTKLHCTRSHAQFQSFQAKVCSFCYQRRNWTTA